MEVTDSVIFGQLIVNFEARLEKLFKQLKFLRFPVKREHRCSEGFRHFRDFTDVVVESGCIGVRRQLLKGQQNLVCFNCR